MVGGQGEHPGSRAVKPFVSGARRGDQGGGAHGDKAGRARGGAGGAQDDVGVLRNAVEPPGQVGAHGIGVLMGTDRHEQGAMVAIAHCPLLDADRRGRPREGAGEDLGECAMQAGDMRLIVSAHDQAGSARGGSRCAHDSRVAHGSPVVVLPRAVLTVVAQDQARLPLG